MAARTFPVADAASSEADWTLHQAADGIWGDTVGTSLRVTANGSSTNVTVAALAANALALIRGVGFDPDGSTTVALGSIGTQPTAGQTRIDRIVLRLDRSSSPYVASIVGKAGTPAASGAAAPGVTRTASTWEMSLAIVTRRGTAAVTQADIQDARTFLGWAANFPVGTGLPDAAPIGSQFRQGSRVHHRRLVGTSVSWFAVDDPFVQGSPVAMELGFNMGTGTGSFLARSLLVANGLGTLGGRIDLPGSGAIAADTILARIAPAAHRPDRRHDFSGSLGGGITGVTGLYVNSDGRVRNRYTIPAASGRSIQMHTLTYPLNG